jgi:hypothetical protein
VALEIDWPIAGVKRPAISNIARQTLMVAAIGPKRAIFWVECGGP